MVAVNTKLSDAVLVHSLYAERMKAGEVTRILKLLTTLERDLLADLQKANLTAFRKARYERLLEQTTQTIRAAYRAMRDQQRETLVDVARLEADWTVRSLNQTISEPVGIYVDVASVSWTPAQLRAIAGKATVDHVVTARWWAKQSTLVRQQYAAVVKDGLLRGTGTDAIVKEVRESVLAMSRRNAEALVRSSIAAVQNDARLATLRQHKELLRGWRWLSTIDHATSLYCLGRDGLTWTVDGTPIGHQIPFNGGPPAHWNALPEGSLIVTTTGWKKIEDVHIGDFVLTHHARFRRVSEVMGKRCQDGMIRRIDTNTGRVLFATNEHPILTFRHGWQRADQIQVGDQLFQYPKKAARIKRSSFFGIRETQNYPSLFDECSIALQVMRFTFDACMCFPVNFNGNAFSWKSNIENRMADWVLKYKGSAAGILQQIYQRFFLITRTHAQIIGERIHDFLQCISIMCRVVQCHALAVHGIERRIFLRASVGPMLRTSYMMGGIGSMSRGSLTLCSNSDVMYSTPIVQTGYGNSQFAFNGTNRKPLVPMLCLDESLDFRFIPQINHISLPQYWLTPTIVSNEGVPYNGDVYNLAVEEDESYVAEGGIVHNCRSTIVPLTLSYAELGGKQLPRMNRKTLETLFRDKLRAREWSEDRIEKALMRTRASMDGSLPVETSMEQFLRSKGKAFQDEQLGKTRANLFRSGQVSDFTRFLDGKGNPLTVKQLQQRYGVSHGEN